MLLNQECVTRLGKVSDCSFLWTNVAKSFDFVFEQEYFIIKSKKKKKPTVLRLAELIRFVQSKSFYIEQIPEVNGGENQKISIFLFTSFAHYHLLTFCLTLTVCNNDAVDVFWSHYSTSKDLLGF